MSVPRFADKTNEKHHPRRFCVGRGNRGGQGTGGEGVRTMPCEEAGNVGGTRGHSLYFQESISGVSAKCTK